MNPNVYKTELYRNPKIQVKRSSIHGWGVFANEDIPQYEVIEECPIVIIDKSELSPEAVQISHYLANMRDKYFIGFGVGSLFNHSREHFNVEWYVDGVNMTQNYYATRDIKSGDELYSCYNPNISFEDNQ